jgi:hypothetical protein
METKFLKKLSHFPAGIALESSILFQRHFVIGIELAEGMPILRASGTIQDRIDKLLSKQQNGSLSIAEEQELDCYEEIDDYLSLVNRTMRNVALETPK